MLQRVNENVYDITSYEICNFQGRNKCEELAQDSDARFMENVKDINQLCQYVVHGECNSTYAEIEEAEKLSKEPDKLNFSDEALKKVQGKCGDRSPKAWEFVANLLLSSESNPTIIKWENKESFTFRIIQKEEIARRWGKRDSKHANPELPYDNFARSLRYHYKTGYMEAVTDKQMVYRFGQSARDYLSKSLSFS